MATGPLPIFSSNMTLSFSALATLAFFLLLLEQAKLILVSECLYCLFLLTDALFHSVPGWFLSFLSQLTFSLLFNKYRVLSFPSYLDVIVTALVTTWNFLCLVCSVPGTGPHTLHELCH